MMLFVLLFVVLTIGAYSVSALIDPRAGERDS